METEVSMTARAFAVPLVLVASSFACGGQIAPSPPFDDDRAPNDGPIADVAPGPERTVPEGALPEASGSRTRWLAYRTFVSSASTQTLLHLIDLKHPELPPIEVERQSAVSVTYSPDGRWLTYRSFRSPSETRLYIIDVSGDKPSAPKLLLQSGGGRPCAWSPDSKKLACIRPSASDANGVAEVIYFDASRSTPGAAVHVGSFASNAHPVDGVFWPDSETLVFPGEGTLTKVGFTGGAVGEPTHFAAPGGAIVRLSPDGRRALVTGLRDYDPAFLAGQNPSFRIVDLELGTSIPLESHRYWSFSESLDAAVAIEPPGGPEPGRRLFFRITDARVVGPVATRGSDDSRLPWSREWQKSTYNDTWLGSRWVEMKDGRPAVITISETGLAEEVVAGDLADVRNLRSSPDGTLLYIGTALLDEKNKPIDATATHWLSRIVDGHPRPAVPFASGYATGGGASISFSPSSGRLLLHGDNGYYQAPEVPVAFRLYDLSGPDIQERTLALPLRWAESAWSRDSSYLSFVGALKERTSFVVDAADAREASRQLFSCSSNPAPLPGCPGGATF
jgi:hypothetical protein